MSGPHVAGLVVLLISANRDLAGNVDHIEELIEQTALSRTTMQVAAATPIRRCRLTAPKSHQRIEIGNGVGVM